MQEDNRALVSRMCDKIESLTKENEKLKATVQTLDNEIKDLKLSTKTVRDVSNKIHKELTESKTKFKREKMDIMKKHNTEIKHLKKELGIETKEKMKVTKKLENLE